MKELLEKEGFMGFECKIQSITARPSDNQNRSAVNVEDYAEATVIYDQKNTILEEELEKLIDKLIKSGKIAKGYITKDDNVCDDKFELVRTKYSQDLSDNDIWFHIWNSPDDKDMLFVKSEKSDENAEIFKHSSINQIGRAHV